MFVQEMELSSLRQHCKVTCFYRECYCLNYGKNAKLHDFTGNGTVCSTIKLQRYVFEQGMELSAVRNLCKYTCLYLDWNCLQYGNIATLHVYLGNATVSITANLQSYMFVQEL